MTGEAPTADAQSVTSSATADHADLRRLPLRSYLRERTCVEFAEEPMGSSDVHEPPALTHDR